MIMTSFVEKIRNLKTKKKNLLNDFSLWEMTNANDGLALSQWTL